jgi:cyclic dehypoxanthinyl futalosine synthase
MPDPAANRPAADRPAALHAAPRPEHPSLDARDPGLLAAVARGEARLTPEQGLELLERAPLHTLGRYADARCRAIHGDDLRTYVIDRNINYTNVCTAKCIFCAFRRDGHEDDAYTLEHEQIFDKIAELSDIGGTQILMQGGMNPDLPLDWYCTLLAGIRERFPHIHIHAFSPPEFIEFVRFFDPPGDTLEAKIRYVMVRLRDAGLASLPGGGGEIFAPAVRTKIGMGKCDAEAWLTCMYVAHTLGMFTSATMMFGHIEGLADRVHHLRLVREWQDRALRETPDAPEPMGHYKAFISWPFQRENTALGRLREWGADPAGRPEETDAPFPGDVVANVHGTGTKDLHPEFGRRLRLAGASAYLRTQALSRLFLDNVYSIGSSWVTMGPHIGQVGLHYGANDMGSVMMEENVVSSAGTTYCLNEPVLCRLIRDAGFTPAQRDNTYDIVRIHDTEASPDAQVADWSAHRVQKLAQEAPRDETPLDLTVSIGAEKAAAAGASDA